MEIRINYNNYGNTNKLQQGFFHLASNNVYADGDVQEQMVRTKIY